MTVDDTRGLSHLTAPPWANRDGLRITGVRAIVTVRGTDGALFAP